MILLADENFPIDSVRILRDAGFDVESIQEDTPSLDDISILDRAVQSGRLLLTFDRDFGDLIFHKMLPAPIGVIYFRFDLITSDEPAPLFLDLVERLKMEGYFTVVTRSTIRQRKLL
ncbi:MAG TPA: DUF5615 family PIN-like protein [Candidatus Kapabacteria bacterium]